MDETRPRLQGARLTAWELQREGVPYHLIADNANGLLMLNGKVDAFVFGADRVAHNGDTANKIGTYKTLSYFMTYYQVFLCCHGNDDYTYVNQSDN